jgi:hypothetical protein
VTKGLLGTRIPPLGTLWSVVYIVDDSVLSHKRGENGALGLHGECNIVGLSFDPVAEKLGCIMRHDNEMWWRVLHDS